MDNPLVDLGRLSEPLTKLIEVLGKGIGTLYAPWGTVRQAKADAKAKILMAKNEQEIASLELRAKSRLEYLESVRQENIEQIAIHAANALPAVVSEKPVEKDWILQFFDCAQNICDEDMQILWGRILAGETAEPGSYSKRTVQFLKTFEKVEAELFTKYCSFLFSFKDGWKFIMLTKGVKNLIIKKCDGYNPTEHFASIGLISTSESVINVSKLPNMKINYFGREYIFEGEYRKKKLVDVGYQKINLTTTGQQLSMIANAIYCRELIDEISKDIKRDYNLILRNV